MGKKLDLIGFKRRFESYTEEKRHNYCINYLEPWRNNNDKALKRLETLLTSRKSNVKWTACVYLGTWLDDAPEEVYQITLKYAEKEGEDLHSAIACCVWEHLFIKKGQHEKIKELLNHPNRNVRWTLAKSFTHLNKNHMEKYLHILSNDPSTYVSKDAKKELIRLRKLHNDKRIRDKR